jgi:hypothetical protein
MQLVQWTVTYRQVLHACRHICVHKPTHPHLYARMHECICAPPPPPQQQQHTRKYFNYTEIPSEHGHNCILKCVAAWSVYTNLSSGVMCCCILRVQGVGLESRFLKIVVCLSHYRVWASNHMNKSKTIYTHNHAHWKIYKKGKAVPLQA